MLKEDTSLLKKPEAPTKNSFVDCFSLFAVKANAEKKLKPGKLPPTQPPILAEDDFKELQEFRLD